MCASHLHTEHTRIGPAYIQDKTELQSQCTENGNLVLAHSCVHVLRKPVNIAVNSLGWAPKILLPPAGLAEHQCHG